MSITFTLGPWALLPLFWFAIAAFLAGTLLRRGEAETAAALTVVGISGAALMVLTRFAP